MVIGHNLSSRIVDFVKSGVFHQVIVFTQKKVKDSSGNMINLFKLIFDLHFIKDIISYFFDGLG